MQRRSALIATCLTLLAGLVAVPSAGAQGGTGGGGTSGGGGGGRPAKCAVVSVDPVTGAETIVCTNLRV